MIKIANKLKPFSHVSGTKVLIPGTSARATIYPARIVIDDLSTWPPTEIDQLDLPLKGPVVELTIFLDFARSSLFVEGRDAKGFFQYTFVQDPFSIKFTRGREGDLTIAKAPVECSKLPVALERLSLGCHKKQDWQQVISRFDMAEILPFWFELAQLVPQQDPAVYEGTASLLSGCCNAIVACDRTQLLAPFEHVLRAGFEGMLSPRLEDSDHHGYSLKSLSKKAKPLAMMVDGALFIRSLFVQRDQDLIKILPALPVEFHSGRMKNIRFGEQGFADLEWTKKTIRRMVFQSQCDGELFLQFQKELKQFRLVEKGGLQGAKHSTQKPIAVEKGKTYILDRFER